MARPGGGENPSGSSIEAGGFGRARLAVRLHARGGNFVEAAQLGRRAFEANRNTFRAHNSLGLTYLYLGFFEAAEQEFRRGAELDPLFLSPYLNIAEALSRQRRFRDALEPAEKGLHLEPDSAMALFANADIHYELGDFAKARSLWESALRNSPQDAAPPPDLIPALFEQGAGHPEEARRLVTGLKESPIARSPWGTLLLRLALRTGLRPEAIELLDACLPYRNYRALVTDPLLGPLRREPAFERLLRTRYGQWQDALTRLGPSLGAVPSRLPAPEQFLTRKSEVGSRKSE